MAPVRPDSKPNLQRQKALWSWRFLFQNQYCRSKIENFGDLPDFLPPKRSFWRWRFCPILHPSPRAMLPSSVDFSARAIHDPVTKLASRHFKNNISIIVPALIIMQMAYDPLEDYGRVRAMIPRRRGGTRKGTKRGPRGNYKETIWWKMIHTEEVKDPTSKVGKLFRKRLRIPFPVFTQIMERVRREQWFPENERQLQSKN